MANVISAREFLERPCEQRCCDCKSCLFGPFQYPRWINGCGKCGKTNAKADLTGYTPTVGAQQQFATNFGTVTKEIIEVVELLPDVCVSSTARVYIGEIKIQYSRPPHPSDPCSFSLFPYTVCSQLFLEATATTIKIVEEALQNAGAPSPNPSAYELGPFAPFALLDGSISPPTTDCGPVVASVPSGNDDEGQIILSPSCCSECDCVPPIAECPTETIQFQGCSNCRDLSANVRVSFSGAIDHCIPSLPPEEPEGPSITNSIDLSGRTFCIPLTGTIIIPDAASQTLQFPAGGPTITNTFDLILSMNYVPGIGGVSVSFVGGVEVFRSDFCICCRDLAPGVVQTAANQTKCPTPFCDTNFPNFPKAIAVGGSVEITTCCDPDNVARLEISARGILPA